MLTVVFGYMGSGKTLFLSALAKMSKKKVVSNYNLSFPHTKFSIYDFVNGKYNNCLVLIDEAYVYIESRLSGSLRNRYMSYMLFQARKKNIEILMSMQLTNSIDQRYRNLSDMSVFCNGVNRKGFRYTIVNSKGRMVKMLMRYEVAEKIYPVFDTNEVIASERTPNESSLLLTTPERKELVEKIAKEILGNNSIKITKNVIQDWVFSHDYPANLEKFIYARIKVIQATNT